ncbi:hypothetical protein ACFOU2_20480 [Bacillus songklensis]|uniref:Uncharacterized protein n=1 Tax=Bacillus songklensis TaxID=1069116 RepID=A0ABV8B8L3_9BACI
MGFFGLVILIFLVYFFIIKPLTQRNRTYGPPRYDRYDRRYEPGRYDGPIAGGRGFGGMGTFGTFAGGLAAGALLTHLFEQGRIGFDQYQHLQQLEDHEAIQELMDQNIIQEDEINELQERLGGDDFANNDDWNGDDQGDFDNQDFGGGDDNWV